MSGAAAVDGEGNADDEACAGAAQPEDGRRSHSQQVARAGVLRWHLQHGRSALPKSTKPTRTAENFDVLDFEFSAEELTRIDELDTGIRGGPEPDPADRSRKPEASRADPRAQPNGRRPS